MLRKIFRRWGSAHGPADLGGDREAVPSACRAAGDAFARLPVPGERGTASQVVASPGPHHRVGLCGEFLDDCRCLLDVGSVFGL